MGWEDTLEKEMATHSSILAWKILWMEEPGRLQSMGLQSLTWLSDFTFFLSISKTSLPKALSPSSVRQSHMIPCNPMDYNLSSSSVHGTFPARILEWVAISFPTPRLYPIKIESLNSNTNITISSLCALNPIISNLGTFHVGVLLCASHSVKIDNQFCLSHWKHDAFIKKQKWKALTYPQENFPGGSVVKNPPASAEDAGLIPWLGRSLEEEMATYSSILA